MLLYLQKTGLIFLFFCCKLSFAQVKFTASISPTTIGKNDFAQLKLSVENANAVEKISTPNFKNFSLQSGPNQESGMTSINGVVKKYIALVYIIKPKNVGTFTISPTTAIADGKEYTSNAVTLNVTNATTNTTPNNTTPFGLLDVFTEPTQETVFKDYIIKKGENPADKVNKNMFVKADVSKTTCFVGEPIVVTYKLYTRLKSESNIVKNPSFNGFSVVDMEQPNSMNYQSEKINGREYNVYTIRKTQLYALQPGIINLEEASVENIVHFVKDEYLKANQQNIFDNFGEVSLPADAYEDFKIILKNNPIAITVKPLPINNVANNFKGAVGSFAINATINKAQFTTDETCQLTIQLSGQGNLQLITTPDVKWPKQIESFEPKITDDLFKGTVPISGSKIITYPFIANAAGSYSLDSISFTYFDTKTGKYKTIYTNPIKFIVTKGIGKKATEVVNTKKENWLSKLFANRNIVISIIAFIILTILFYWTKKDKKKTDATINKIKLVEEEKVALEEKFLLANKNWLSQSKYHMDDNDETNFYKTLNIELKEFIAFKTGLTAATLNKKAIADWFDENKINYSLQNKWQVYLNEVDDYLYNPFANKKPMQTMYENGAELIEALQKH